MLPTTTLPLSVTRAKVYPPDLPDPTFTLEDRVKRPGFTSLDVYADQETVGHLTINVHGDVEIGAIFEVDLDPETARELGHRLRAMADAIDRRSLGDPRVRRERWPLPHHHRPARPGPCSGAVDPRHSPASAFPKGSRDASS